MSTVKGLNHIDENIALGKVETKVISLSDFTYYDVCACVFLHF